MISNFVLFSFANFFAVSTVRGIKLNSFGCDSVTSIPKRGSNLNQSLRHAERALAYAGAYVHDTRHFTPRKLLPYFSRIVIKSAIACGG